MSARFSVYWALLLAGMSVLPRVRADEPPPRNGNDLEARADELFASWNRHDSPGCAVGIVQGGKLIYSKGFGSANLEYGVPNTPQTVIDVMSFTKSLTCACLAMLMDEGKLAPDDELRKYVPEMHPFDPPIRIRDLVCCKSGIWDQTSLSILIGCENAPQQVPLREADYFSLLAGQRTLPFQPGTEHRYSGGDYFLLGTIINRITGQSLGEFARRRIFEPLGMRRTFFQEDATRVVEQRMVGHWKPTGDEWRIWRPTGYWAGGGNLNTCVDDLYRWDQAFSGRALPRGKYLSELLEEGTLLGNRYCLDADAAMKETNRLARDDALPGKYRGLRRRQFTGGAWGMTSAMTQFPDQEFTAICLSNCEEITAWHITRRIADLYLADRLQPVAVRPTMRPASELPTASVSEAELRDKVGAYRVKNRGVIWTIALADGGLALTNHLGATMRLRPLSATRFDPEGPWQYPTTQYVFAPVDSGPPMLTTQWDEPENPGQLEFDRVELVDPTPTELAEMAGEYFCDELAAVYRLEVRDGKLWLRVNSRRWEQLDATVRDEFIPHIREPADARQITFLRNSSGQVTGLSIDYYRIRDVRFEKQ
jgi:CubicO group peptidase (beta-lactamase class C family)